MSATQRQVPPSSYSIASQRAPQPMWKKVCQRTKDSTSIQKSKNKNTTNLQNQAHNQQSINQFLWKIQKKISESRLSCQSEVMEKISIDWPQQIPISSRLTRYVSFESPTRSEKDICIKCEEMALLKDIINIQKLVQFLRELNPTLHQQLLKMTYTNKALTQQNTILKQNQTRTKQKISNLCKHILALQNRNSELVKDYNRLSDQVSIQIKIQEEKIKYQYEQIIQEMKLQIQKKIDREQSAKTLYNAKSADRLTKCSSFSLDSVTQSGQQSDRPIEIDQINKCRSAKDKILVSMGNNKQENFERVVFDIIKPYRRQDRSLKLPQSSISDYT